MSLSSCRVNNHSSHGFNTKDVRTIDAGDVQRLISRLTRESKEPKTIRSLWGTISLIWQAARAQKFVDSTLPKPKLPSAAKKRPRFFKLADVGTHFCLIHPFGGLNPTLRQPA